MTLEDIKVKARKILFGKNPNDSLPVVSKNFNDLIDYISALENTINILSGGTSGTVVYTDLDPVISQTNTPPAHVLGERYLINTAPTGAWVGNANSIAESDGAAWTYTVPVLDDYVYITSTLQTLRYNGTAWVSAPARAILQNGNSFGATGVRVGTNDAFPTWLKTNNALRIRVDGSTGDVRIANSTKIGNTTTAPDSKAILDVVSTTKGILIPRLTTIQKNAITSPTTGLLVFDTDLGTFNFYTGAAWTSIVGTLAEVLAVGASTGNTAITSIDGLTFLELSNNFGQITSSDGVNITGQVFLDSANIEAGLNLSDGTIQGSVALTATSTDVKFNDGADANAEVLLNATEAFIYFEDGTDYGGVTINGTSTTVEHSQILSLLAPTINIVSSNTFSNATIADGSASLNYDNQAGAVAAVFIDDTQHTSSWTDGTDSGSSVINATNYKITHTQKIELDAPLIDMASLQTGNAGLAAGELYVDTAANILANGDLILARKV